MAKNPTQGRFSSQFSQESNEVEIYMNQKGVEYRTIDKSRAGRIYERLKAHITPPKRTIQVLGTNGKGSTGRFLALMLMQNGASVLHFTSPHIFSFSERFYKNGAIIGDDELLEAHRFLQRFDFISECSYFEYATFLALALAQGVDYFILEAGVGGELDSTSVIPREMCVFSVIDYDHTEILGESIEEIATTKLNAVWYPNFVPKMVLGAQKYEVVEKIAKEIAKVHSVEIYTLDSADSAPSYLSNSRISFAKRAAPPTPLPLRAKKLRFFAFRGRASLSPLLAKNRRLHFCNLESDFLHHEAGEFSGASHGFDLDSANLSNSQNLGENSKKIAESALDSADSAIFSHKSYIPHFLSQNLNLALKALEILGLQCDLSTLPPLDLRGRFEAIAPNITIDVGHNQNAAFAIRQSLGQKKVILVYNSYFQKNIGEILATLKGNIKSVQILRIHGNPRIIKQEILEQILGNLNIPYKNFDGAKSLDKDENYLVFGSFSVVEAFMRDYSGENRK